MIAEQTSVYDLTSSPVTGLTAGTLRRPSVPRIVHRIVDACVRFVKAPVLPHADLWAASVTIDLLREPERQSRPAQSVVELDYRTDAWLRH
jgi:hypothetical protein